MANHQESFGDYLYRLREKQGWTLREAAKRTEVAFSRLGEWERGVDSHSGRPIVPSYHIVCRLARIYGVPREELLRLAGYGPELTEDEQLILAGFRELPEGGRRSLLEHLAHLRSQFAEYEQG